MSGDRRAIVLAVVIVLGGGTSMATGHPFSNVALDGNDDGWFTTENLDAYGDDLDGRLEPGEWVFSAHPAYVMESDDARLVFDRPRTHYFAITFQGTNVGDRQYQRLARAFANGSVPYAIVDNTTRNMLSWEGAFFARKAFEDYYCRVDDDETQALYNRTDATLYRYAWTCPDDRRPDIDA